MARFVLESLGCKLNQAEVEALAHELVRRGHQLTDTVDCADVYILNTCTVTHVADRKSRHALRMARRRNPHVSRVALGCYVRRAGDDLLHLGIVDQVVASREPHEVADQLERSRHLRRSADCSGKDGNFGRTRSFIKVQEGCNSLCSFCIVPYVRTPEASRPIEVILRETQNRMDEGVKEIVLTGTSIGDYHSNGLTSGGLADLVTCLLHHTELSRLRLSSLGPRDLSPEMLEMWNDRRLCPHLHLPLQSGSESVLKRMNRPYSLTEYARGVERARQAIPDLTVTTDIMVGFPGETDEEFEESYRFCALVGFAAIHVFSFSSRANTPAASLPHQIDESIKKERSTRMLDLSRQSASRYRAGLIGRTMEVLWEKRSGKSLWDGLTANYLRVFAESDEDLSGRLRPARLVAEHAQGLTGLIVHGGGNG